MEKEHANYINKVITQQKIKRIIFFICSAILEVISIPIFLTLIKADTSSFDALSILFVNIYYFLCFILIIIFIKNLYKLVISFKITNYKIIKDKLIEKSIINKNYYLYFENLFSYCNHRICVSKKEYEKFIENDMYYIISINNNEYIVTESELGKKDYDEIVDINTYCEFNHYKKMELPVIENRELDIDDIKYEINKENSNFLIDYRIIVLFFFVFGSIMFIEFIKSYKEYINFLETVYIIFTSCMGSLFILVRNPKVLKRKDEITIKEVVITDIKKVEFKDSNKYILLNIDNDIKPIKVSLNDCSDAKIDDSIYLIFKKNSDKILKTYLCKHIKINKK